MYVHRIVVGLLIICGTAVLESAKDIKQEELVSINDFRAHAAWCVNLQTSYHEWGIFLRHAVLLVWLVIYLYSRRHVPTAFDIENGLRDILIEEEFLTEDAGNMRKTFTDIGSRAEYWQVESPSFSELHSRLGCCCCCM